MKYVRINLKAEVRRRTASIVIVTIFGLILAAMFAAAVLLERPLLSEIENRELEKRPEFSMKSYLDGSFAERLDRYFTDTVPFRDTLTQYASVIENAKGIPSPQFYGVKIVNDPSSAEEDPFEEAATETTAASETSDTSLTDKTVSGIAPPVTMPQTSDSVTTAPPAVTSTAAAEATETAAIVSAEDEEEFVGDIKDFINNGILVNGVDMYGEKAGIMLFGGNDKQGERYANLINYCKKSLGDSVNVYNLVVPTSVEFYLPKKYSKFSNSEKDEIDFIYSKLDDSVITVDAYSALEAHKDEYIYFRTDHHWSDLGAYYAYTAFCEAIGQTPPPLSDYTVKTKEEPYVGSLYGYTNNIILKNNPDTFTYYMTKSEFTGESFYYDTLKSAGANPIYHEYAKGSGMYGMFLGSDAVHVKITTKAGTGRKIVMFKESYGNAFAPYLIDSFDEIYVIDIRYFGRNAIDYIKQVGATDVLFINNVFAANTSTLISGIERLLTSPTGTVVVTAPPVTTTAAPAVQTVNGTVTSPAGTSPAVTSAPVTGAPVTDKSVTGKPVTNKPVTDKPVTGIPATDKSVTEKPPAETTVTTVPPQTVPVTTTVPVQTVPPQTSAKPTSQPSE